MFKKTFASLKIQVIIGMFLGVAIMAVSVIWDFNSILDENLLKTINKEKISIKESFDNRLNSRISLLKITMDMLFANKTVISNFAGGDRDGLKFQLLDDYKNKIKSKGIFQFQFHTPDNHSFLRLHKPEKFGDDLSAFRKTVVACNSTQKLIAGIEIGKYGPSLRIVSPVNWGGVHVGSVEFGADLNKMLGAISKEYHILYSIGLKSDLAKLANYQKLETDFVSDDYLYIYNPSPAMRELIKNNKPSDEIKIVQIGEEYYSFYFIPIHDFEGNEIGYLTVAQNQNDAFQTKNDNISSIIIFISIFAAFFFIAAVIYFTKRITSPIQKCVVFANELSEGSFDSNLTITSKNEIGRLADSLRDMKANLAKMFTEVKEKSQQTEEAATLAAEAQKIAEDEQKYLSESTQEMLYAMDQFASGDLTVSLSPKKEGDDISRLYIGFNKAVQKFNDLIKHVTEVVEATASASAQISASAEQMAAGTSEQSSQSAEVAGAVEEMTLTIQETTQNANIASNLAKESGTKSYKGVQRISEAKTGMEKIVVATNETRLAIHSLSEKTGQIGEITKVIDEIADQTNLLALNAAIEAARAGEFGRGFAVVADEVRKLAERTMKATKEISEMIVAIQDESGQANKSVDAANNAVQEGKVKTEEVEVALNEILEGTKKVEGEIAQLAAASKEESSAATEIANNMEVINNVAQETAAGIHQIANATEDLMRLTENLKDMTSAFNIMENTAKQISSNRKNLLT